MSDEREKVKLKPKLLSRCFSGMRRRWSSKVFEIPDASPPATFSSACKAIKLSHRVKEISL